MWWSLRRALVRNPPHVVQSLSRRYSQGRKYDACKAIAKGMNLLPDATDEFLRIAASQLHPDHIYYLLKYSIEFAVESTELDTTIALWLNDYYHRSGYGRMLHALVTRRRQWDRLQSLGTLQIGIKRDYDRWAREDVS